MNADALTSRSADTVRHRFHRPLVLLDPTEDPSAVISAALQLAGPHGVYELVAATNLPGIWVPFGGGLCPGYVDIDWASLSTKVLEVATGLLPESALVRTCIVVPGSRMKEHLGRAGVDVVVMDGRRPPWWVARNSYLNPRRVRANVTVPVILADVT